MYSSSCLATLCQYMWEKLIHKKYLGKFARSIHVGKTDPQKKFGKICQAITSLFKGLLQCLCSNPCGIIGLHVDM